ncbi:hypothetical protein HYH03_011911 [Edaphochlamys debaryana]|uniref:Uncharacterized protein n=1 Tax=Edaphochlamys debaryana TaxID=47281 RepID=A0A835XR62_9CHLO|nr:hypothetical protein HYH03_011911 [Edaphochlamys debaryana]|eukprot:KAG2489632.1 hypothetical protein HYH03_011911 [Edaphochlamys debaryana]
MCVMAGQPGILALGSRLSQNPCVGATAQVFIPEPTAAGAGGAYRFRSAANTSLCWSTVLGSGAVVLAPCAGGGLEQEFVFDNLRHQYQEGGGWKVFYPHGGRLACVGMANRSGRMELLPASEVSCILDIIPAGVPADLVPECAYWDALNGILWQDADYLDQFLDLPASPPPSPSLNDVIDEDPQVPARWTDAARPGQLLGLGVGDIEYDITPSGGYGSLKFNGQSSAGMLPTELVGWNRSSAGAFSIVIIYKLDADAGDDYVLLDMSSSDMSFWSWELQFGANKTFLRNRDSFAMEGSIPSSLPREQWIMASYVRQAGGKEGFLLVAWEGASAQYTETWTNATPIYVDADYYFVLGADFYNGR